MKGKHPLDVDNDVFSSELVDDILIMRQKRHIFYLTHDIDKIASFYQFMEMLLGSKKFKALIVFGEQQKEPMTEYIHFMCEAMRNFYNRNLLGRLFNVVNNFIVTLTSINGVTVYAGRDRVSLFRLNVSLAYDYRIYSDNTVFENFNTEFGLITKGSGYFMPRLLGVKKASEVLQWRTFSAEEALQLDLVDRITPTEKLEEEALELVRMNLKQQTSTLLGIRKLLKCDQEALKRSLELEDQLLKERLESYEFKETFGKYCLEKYGIEMEDAWPRE